MSDILPPEQLSTGLREAAAQLGISNLTGAGDEVVQLCTELAEGTVLPAGWTSGYDTKQKRTYFVDQVKRETSWVHPLLPYYTGAVFMVTGGKQALMQAEANKPCTEQEVRDMASYLGIDPDSEPGLLDIARMAIAAPVLPGWQQVDTPDGYAVFRNAQTGQQQEAHPLDDYFTELIRRRRQQQPAVTASKQAASVTALQQQNKPQLKPSPLSKPQISASQKTRDSTGSSSGSSYSDGGSESEADESSVDRQSRLEGRNGSAEGLELSSSVAASSPAGPSPRGTASEAAAPGAISKQEIQSDSAGPASAAAGRTALQHSNSQRAERQEAEASNAAAPIASQLWHGNRVSPALDAQSDQRSEQMHVAVRARPVPSYLSPCCWNIDTVSGTISLNPAAASKKKQTGANPATAAAMRTSTDWEVNSTKGFADSRLSTPAGASTVYKFDTVLDEMAQTEEAYLRCIQSLVQSALQGVNATVLAYGQTGSGKTHTIMGERNEAGAISLAIDDIFATAAATSSDAYTFRVDMVEIYNEELRDLLAPVAAKQKQAHSLQIKEDALMGVRVSGAYQEVVSDAARMKQLFQRGNSRRQTSSHNLNAVSSRSHAIFQIVLECRRSGAAAVQVSTLNFVDLAGSERIEKSGSEFEAARTKEANYINVSLLMLGNVISKLAERSTRSVPGGKFDNSSFSRLGSPARTAHSSPDHIPYRNSKLTRLLQPSLGGNARTAIIATINPSADQMDETLHTLRLASRAMAVTNHISVNRVMSDGDLAKQYQAELKRLRHRLSRRGSGEEDYAAVYALKQQVRRLEDHNLALGLQLEASTGRPAQDWGSLPHTPPDLSLPSQWSKASRGPTSPEQALKLIARTTALNRPTLPSSFPQEGSLGPSSSFTNPADRLYGRASSDDVVQSVRRLRAERDQLRLRDRDHTRHLHQVEDQLLELEQLHRQLPLLEKATTTLEDLVGASSTQSTTASDPGGLSRDPQDDPRGLPLPERLEQAVAAASIVSAELQSMHRQLVTSGLLLQQEEARAAQLQADLVRAKARDQGQSQAAAASGQGQSKAGTALQLVKVLQQQVDNLEGRLAAQEKKRKELQKELLQWCSLEPSEGQQRPTPVGSAAVSQAHQATLRAQKAERRLAAAVAERDALACQVQELKPPELPDQTVLSSSEAAHSPEDQLQRMRKKVYALSSEVAHLTRERDVLRVQIGQPPGPTLPAGSVKLQNAVLSVPGTAASSSVTQGIRLQPGLIASSSGRLPESLPGQPLPMTQGLQLTAENSGGTLSTASAARGLRSLFNFHESARNSPRASKSSPRAAGKKRSPGPKARNQNAVRGRKGMMQDAGSADWALGAVPFQGLQLGKEAVGKAGWVDPTSSEDTPAKQLEVLRRRLVASERDRKQSLADAAAENRALQLQVQRLEKTAQQANQLDQQLVESHAQQALLAHLNEALQARSVAL